MRAGRVSRSAGGRRCRALPLALTLLFASCWMFWPLLQARSQSSTVAADRPQEPALIALLEPNHFVLMRHATAPGLGDPPDFKIDQCSTQRNLSEAGRRQAQAIGALLRSAGVIEARVLSSRWCRCLETARLIGLGPVTEFEPLNSFHGKRERAAGQLEQLRAEIFDMDLTQPVIFVTHQVVVTGLTGRSVASGESLVMRRLPDGTLGYVGSIPAPTAD